MAVEITGYGDLVIEMTHYVYWVRYLFLQMSVKIYKSKQYEISRCCLLDVITH